MQISKELLVMNFVKKLFLVVLSLSLILGVSTPVKQSKASEPAVIEDTYFTPLRVGTASQVYFHFKNTANKQSKLYTKIVTKDFPKGNENNWFVQFCYSNICFLEDGESPITVRKGETEEMHVTLWPYEGAKVGEKIKIVLEVNPVIDKNLKTTITFYAICVAPKEVKLTIGKKIATVNSKSLTLDVAPYVNGGRTLVPLRFIGDNLGAKIDWEPKTQKITFTLDQKIVVFWVGKTEVQVKIGPKYSKMITFDAAPVISSGRTFVPVRAVSELLGGEVLFDGPTRVITINFPPLPSE
jgi:hypothetical protein